jgi:CheY-like chemotaxis protein
LTVTSKYKSEFLANMSHELRTPLNSLLILSDQLSKNPEGNLTPRQTEFAKTIHSSGNDLLTLINDILDLSKIESGTVNIEISELRLGDLNSYVERTFRHVAEAKNVGFDLRFDPHLPQAVLTDSTRLQQVIKNLLSNAFKFTQQGHVSLTVAPAQGGWSPENEELTRASSVLAFSVADTGIGIPPDKQQIIFEPFTQADGSTSRKYGGTGLGLAISREISRRLGGEIKLVSTPGEGSTFTLYLPQSYTPPKPAPRKSAVVEASTANGATRGQPVIAAEPIPEAPVKLVNEVGDDRDGIQPGDSILLIVENDLAFAKLILESAHEKGFKALVTSLGAAALAMAREYKPAAISLDICLPDIDGWRVIERLKNDTATRHIPVCVVSTEEARERALASGALGALAKPLQTREALDGLLDSLREFIGRPVKSLLVAGRDAAWRERVLGLIGSPHVQITAARSGPEAQQMLRERRVDCAVFHPDLPDLDPRALANEAAAQMPIGRLPVVVYGDGDPPHGPDGWVSRGEGAFTVRHAHSPERLLDQVTFHLHLPVGSLPPSRRLELEHLHQTDRVLAGKKVLIVDDDIRNIFALTSVLEWHNMQIRSAETGRDAIAILQAEPDVDIVLMDIMMPEMDGMETTRAIRQLPRFQDLPIVAVTAKAMKGDREKCIEAGAWDYLSKPVDTEQMLSVLRAWLHR